MCVSVRPSTGCVRGKAVDSLRPLTTGLSPGRGKLAVLSRSNVSVFDQAVRLTDANPHCSLHIIGVSLHTPPQTHTCLGLVLDMYFPLQGVENFGLKRIMDIWVLMQPENNRSRGEWRTHCSLPQFCNFNTSELVCCTYVISVFG